MQDVINSVLDRKERPAYVRFKRVAVEDKAQSLKRGYFVGKDVDYAYITPPYSKDEIIRPVPQWMEKLEQDVKAERFPVQWLENYRDQYKRWQLGQEDPIQGTPVKGWNVISPAQQELLISMRIMAVEDVAVMNDEAIRRIGMGGIELRDKAKAWLAQMNDKGPLTLQMAAVQAENRTLTDQVEALAEQVKKLTGLAQLAQVQQVSPATGGEAPTATISLADLDMDPVDPVELAPTGKRKIK